MSSRWIEIIMRSTLSGSARNLAMAIADGANQDGECVMRLTTIRIYAGGVSETTAKRAIRQMEADGVISIGRDKCGRVEVIQLHPMDPAKMDPAKMDPAKMDPAKMDPAKMDPAKMDPAKMDPAKMDPAKMDPAKMDPAKEVVIIGKSQEESGLQDSDGSESGAKDGESGPSAPLVPPPSFPPQTPPYYPPTLNPPNSTELTEIGDARGKNPNPEQGTMFEIPEPMNAKAKKGTMVKQGKTEVMAFVLSMGLEPEDGEYIFENWEAGGWTRNGKPIKDWRACCRAWKAGRYFPSQKVSTGRGGVVRGYRKIDYSKGF